MARIGPLARAAHRMGVEPAYRALDLAAEQIGAADLVVSTLPPRAADDIAAMVGDRLAGAVSGVLLDVAYDPRPTALSMAWTRAGGRVVPGERMLLHQAAEQVRLMTGRSAPVQAMDRVLQTALAATLPRE